MTKIPLPGGSGNVPSGPMQFDDDWPGLFLRGDTAVVLSAKIRGLAQALKEKKEDDPRVWACLIELERIADVIDHDVRMK